MCALSFTIPSLLLILDLVCCYFSSEICAAIFYLFISDFRCRHWLLFISFLIMLWLYPISFTMLYFHFSLLSENFLAFSQFLPWSTSFSGVSCSICLYLCHFQSYSFDWFLVLLYCQRRYLIWFLHLLICWHLISDKIKHKYDQYWRMFNEPMREYIFFSCLVEYSVDVCYAKLV